MEPGISAFRKKVLFVCARNKIRSCTAEKMFAGSLLYDVKSRGVAKDARIKLSAADLRWADLIFVMEKNHKDRIAKEFREELAGKKIVVLFIEDIYEPMEESLVAILRQQLAPHLQLP
ncbi:MAG TPA: protein tyrosine phosphatase [Opitutaceae bacterium]|nr:protein tyrosine phosphatase [Opitutaceae bacterium]